MRVGPRASRFQAMQPNARRTHDLCDVKGQLSTLHAFAPHTQSDIDGDFLFPNTNPKPVACYPCRNPREYPTGIPTPPRRDVSRSLGTSVAETLRDKELKDGHTLGCADYLGVGTDRVPGRVSALRY